MTGSIIGYYGLKKLIKHENVTLTIPALYTHGMASLVKEHQAGNPNVCLTPDSGNYTVALKVPVIVKHKRGRKVIFAPDSESLSWKRYSWLWQGRIPGAT